MKKLLLALAILLNTTGIANATSPRTYLDSTTNRPGIGAGTDIANSFTAANTFTGLVTISANNIATDTTTGMKIGTATSQKLGFFNATPIVQPTGNVCTALQNLGLVASCTESGGSGITVGSTTITSGTTTRILYDNAGVVGEYTLTGTGTVVAMQAGPTFTGTLSSANHTITSASANAFTVGANGTTNPAFNIDESTASAIGGLNFVAAATGGTNTLTVTDSGANGGLTINGKGSGVVNIGTTGSGLVTVGNGSNTVTITSNGTTINGGNSLALQWSGTSVLSWSSSGRVMTTAARPNGGSSSVHYVTTTPADTTITASTSAAIATWGASTPVNRQWATGTLADDPDYILYGNKASFVGASANTKGETLQVGYKDCGTNSTCSDIAAIDIPTRAIAGTTTAAEGLRVAAPSGATSNYAAIFSSGNVGIGTATPLATLDVKGNAVVEGPAVLTISTATFTPTFNTANDFSITLIHASCPCTLANPSGTIVPGQKGLVYVTQSATGSDAITTWGSSYVIAGGTSAITLSTGANAIDVFSYAVKDATHIVLSGPVLNVTH